MRQTFNSVSGTGIFSSNASLQSRQPKPAGRVRNRRLQMLSLAAIGTLTAAPAARAATYTWANGDTTGLWNSTSTTTDWSSAVYPNAAGVIAQGPAVSAGNGTVTLNVNATVGEIKPGSASNGAGFVVNGSAYTLTMDPTGLGTNDFGDTNAEIRDASGAGTFTVNTNLSMYNGGLDIGWVNTGDTAGMTIGTLGTTTILNAGSTASSTTAQTLNFLSDSKGGTANPSVTVNSAIGTSGAPIAIVDNSSLAGYVIFFGTLGSSVTTVTDNGAARMFFGAAESYTGNTTVAAGAELLTSKGYETGIIGTQIFPYGANAGNIINNGTIEMAGTAEQINGLSGTTAAAVIQNTKWDGASQTGGSSPTLTIGNNNANGDYAGYIAGSSGRTISLTKVGSGTQIFNNGSGSWALTGNILISGGTLQIGDGSNATASLGTNAYTDNANLGYDYNGAVSVSNTITGTGSVTQLGSAALTLSSAANTFSGGLNINSSSVIAGNANTGVLGSGTVTMAAGTTLDMGGNSPTTGLLSASTTTPVITNNGSSAATLTISGTSTQTFAGIIQNGSSSNIGLTKSGTGIQILSGASTYTGSTTINAGQLTLSSSGSLGNTAISVAPGSTFAPLPGNAANFAGTTGAGSLGATLDLLPGTGSSAGGIFNMIDNATGTFSLNQQASFSGPALILGGTGSTANAPTLVFDLGSNSADTLNVSTGSVTVGATGADVTITHLTGLSSITPGNYTLISAPGGGLTPLTLTANSFVIGSTAYSLSLSAPGGTSEVLTVAVNSLIPINAYWTGANGTSWSAAGPTNFATTNTGTTPTGSAPGGGTNVFMTADGAATSNFSTTLDGGFSINSLTFTGTGTNAATASVTVAAGSGGSLTLGAANAFTSTSGGVTKSYNAGTGLVVEAGSAAHTISVPIVLGASQSWFINNTSTSPLTVSGTISDGGFGYSLTKTGVGTLLLDASNTYTGGTTITAGTIQIGTVGAIPTGSSLTINGGTLDLDGNGQTLATLSDGGVSTGSIIDSGAAATLNISGASISTFSGSIRASAANLLYTGSSTLTLSGTNTYNNLTQNSGLVALTGSNTAANGVNVNGGTTTVSSTGSITGGTTSYVAVGDNGNFTLNGGTISVANFYTNSNGTSTTLMTGGSLTLSGSLNLDTDNGAANASYFQLSGGTITTAGITIGRTGASETNGAGSLNPVLSGYTAEGLYVTAGIINDSGNLSLGTSHLCNSNANARMDGGIFNVSGSTVITDDNSSRLSTLDINGGTFTSGSVQMGGDYAASAGELLVRNGVANVGGIIFGDATQTAGPNVLELLGGALYVGASGIVNNGAVTPEFNLGGTTYATAPILAASAPWSSSVLVTLTNSSSGVSVVIQAANASGGAVNITYNGYVEGTGALTKTGAGTLFLTAANGYSGKTFINAGTLNINGQFALGGADYTGTTFNGGTLQYASAISGSNGSGDITQNSGGTAEPVTIAAGDGTIDTNGNAISFASPLGNAGSGNLTVVDSSNSSGSLTLHGSSTYTGSTAVTSGSLIVAASGTLPNNTPVIVNGTLNLSNPTQTLSSVTGSGILSLNSNVLTISSHTGTSVAETIGSLSLSGGSGAWTSTLDLKNNALILHSGTLTTVTNQVQQAYANGTWQGSGGITSSVAAADSTHLTALGVIVNDTNGVSAGGHPLYGSGGGIASTFAGAAPADGDILVKYTYYGDTDLNGTVDGTDYSRIDLSYANEDWSNGVPTNRISGWFNGDFNYDGVVDGSDYTLMDNAFNSQGAAIASELAAPTAEIAVQSSASAAVPEPGSLGLLGIGVIGLLGRRNRRRR